MPYLEQKRNLWYAVLTIPKDVREALGKLRFVISTGEGDKRDAQRIAYQYVAGWQLRIEQARGANTSPLSKAILYRQELEQLISENDKEVFLDILTDKAEDIENKHGLSTALEFYALASGNKTLTSTSYEQWKTELNLAPKTIDQMTKDVKLFIENFTTLDTITKSSVKLWLDKLGATGNSLISNRRILGGCRNYWKYLQSYDLVPADFNPFAGVLTLTKKAKIKSKRTKLVFEPSDIVKLYNSAFHKGDKELADLIMLGAYTGARIEELCSLKLDDINSNSIKIVDSKTQAGIRTIPIHSALADLVIKLKSQSKDDYLLTGLTFNKYGDRSNAMGKRFGRLKTSLGFTSYYVYHSIRATVITQLENRGVPENITADIIGHHKPRMTYGLYSDGSGLNIMGEALEKISYPF